MADNEKQISLLDLPHFVRRRDGDRPDSRAGVMLRWLLSPEGMIACPDPSEALRSLALSDFEAADDSFLGDDEAARRLLSEAVLSAFALGAAVGKNAAEVIAAWHSQKQKERANKRHSLPGGSREKRQAIRDAWASGKYSSRDRCAEEECAALGMSFSVARRALKGTPDPA